MKIRALSIFMFLGLFAASCSKDSKEDAGFSVTTKSIEFLSGEKAQIVADGPTSIYYKVRNIEVAIANNLGEVTAQKVGKTEIVVTDGTHSSTVPVEVKAKYSLWDAPIGNVTGSSVSDLIDLRGKPTRTSSNSTNPNITYVIYESDNPKILFLSYVFDQDKLKTVDLRYVPYLCPNVKDAFKERYFEKKQSKYDLELYNRSKSSEATMRYVFNDKYNSILYYSR
ncbi:Ig-like domain-containing protein [Halosquirtibacter xylanolyticus]|uniref:hypothetical protein n=1 Tax=Halosquirtibacter xylanolyticus TaxID=3374599 RepID=UPI003747931F|nr:Ig-like domain-containing protein [Prolixibacteraceae bacterium]